MTLPEDLRARVLAASRAEPSPPRRGWPVGALGGAALSLSIFLAVGGARLYDRPVGLIAATAGGAALIGLAGWLAVRRGRSMLGPPGVRIWSALALVPAGLLGWKVWSSAQHAAMSEPWPERPGLRCLSLGLVIGGALLIGLAWDRRRADPLRPRLTGAALGLLAGAAAWGLTDLWCPVAWLPHLLLGHLLPLGMLVAVGALAGDRALAISTAALLALVAGCAPEEQTAICGGYLPPAATPQRIEEGWAIPAPIEGGGGWEPRLANGMWIAARGGVDIAFVRYDASGFPFERWYGDMYAYEQIERRADGCPAAITNTYSPPGSSASSVTAEYTCDEAGHPIQIEIPARVTSIDLTYQDDRVVRATIREDTSPDWYYDERATWADGRLIEATWGRPDGDGGYRWDYEDGRLVSLTEWDGGSGGDYTTTYQYDNQGRAIRAERSSGLTTAWIYGAPEDTLPSRSVESDSSGVDAIDYRVVCE